MEKPQINNNPASGVIKRKIPRFPSITRLHLMLAVLMLVFIEGVSWLAVEYLEKIGIFFDRDQLQQDYRQYQRLRHPILGWLAPKDGVDEFGARKDLGVHAASAPCIDVYGDSFVWADEVEHEQAWPALLTERLQCRVRNFGVPAYGSDQAYLRFLGMPDKSTVVILGHLSENILRNLSQFRNFIYPDPRYGFKPRFVLERGRLERVPLPAVPPQQIGDFLDHPGQYLRQEYFLPGQEYGPLMASFPYSLAVARSYKNWKIRQRLAGGPQYARFYSPQHSSGGLALTTAILTQFQDRATAMGLTAVVAVFPTCRDFEAYRRTGQFPYASLTAELARGHGRHIDLGAEIAKRHAGDFGELFASCSGHFNAQGNALVADIVADYLAAQGIVP